MRLVNKPAALAVLLLVAAFGWAADTQEDLNQRIDASAQTLTAIMQDPANAIPSTVLQVAKCIAVIPSMIQVAVAVGGSHGKGFVTCRTSGGWSAPAPISITGGSWGAQIGGESVDLVMLVRTDQGMQHLLSSQMKFGTEASVAAGPVSRHAGVDQDSTLSAEVLTYSRARGVFAGTNFNGASLTQDEDDTRTMYGRDASFNDILSGHVPTPTGSRPLLEAVEKYASQAKSER